MVGPLPYQEFGNYDDYWQQRKSVAYTARRWQLAADEIESGSSVLDIGCGSGEFLEYLVSRKGNLQVEGTDYSSEAVRMAAEKGFSTKPYDVTSGTLDSMYDYVTLFEVIEHVPDAELALKNIKNAFRNQLIISIPNVGYIGSRLRLAVFGRYPITMCVFHVKEHVRLWTVKDFKEWMVMEGLVVTKIEGQYGPSWLPWKRFPNLCSSGLVYFIEHQDR